MQVSSPSSYSLPPSLALFLFVSVFASPFACPSAPLFFFRLAPRCSKLLPRTLPRSLLSPPPPRCGYTKRVGCNRGVYTVDIVLRGGGTTCTGANSSSGQVQPQQGRRRQHRGLAVECDGPHHFDGLEGRDPDERTLGTRRYRRTPRTALLGCCYAAAVSDAAGTDATSHCPSHHSYHDYGQHSEPAARALTPPSVWGCPAYTGCCTLRGGRCLWYRTGSGRGGRRCDAARDCQIS